MEQVTGLQIGTPQTDVIAGEIDREVEIPTTESGILNATISSLSGSDSISGMARIRAVVPGAAIEANGIAQSNIDSGLGSDIISGEGRGIGINTGSESVDSENTVVGRGLFRSSVSGGNGGGTMSFRGSASNGSTSTAFGIESSSIDGGGGSQIIGASATASNNDDSGTDIVRATASENGIIRAGGQDDRIQMNATAVASYPTTQSTLGNTVAFATAANNSLVSGDGGNDIINIRAGAGGSAQQAGSTTVNAKILAVSASEIRGGSGDDALSVNTVGLQSTSFDQRTAIASNVGVGENSTFSGDGGNDSISINVVSETETSNNFGVRQAKVEGGDGVDAIAISARADSFTGTVYGVQDTEVDGGNDDDTITITADWNGAVFVNGASADRSTVRGGAGNDTLLFELSAATGNKDRTLATLRDSEVYGNSGDDIITVRTEGVVDYDLIDAQLFGGAGNDLFNVGIGTGTISGGAGADVANLDYLDTQPATVETITNGVRVSGTQTRLGAEGTWTQDILGVESYTVNGVVYDSASLAEAF